MTYTTAVTNGTYSGDGTPHAGVVGIHTSNLLFAIIDAVARNASEKVSEIERRWTIVQDGGGFVDAKLLEKAKKQATLDRVKKYARDSLKIEIKDSELREHWFAL